MTPWERIVSSTINRMKRQHTEWEGIFAILYLKKVLYTKHTRTTTTQLQKEKKKIINKYPLGRQRADYKGETSQVPRPKETSNLGEET